jgi:hypothetical protein
MSGFPVQNNYIKIKNKEKAMKGVDLPTKATLLLASGKLALFLLAHYLLTTTGSLSTFHS